ncbi:MAG: cache domain-containing protein, partial [Thermodesulfobacteriota bacterium]
MIIIPAVPFFLIIAIGYYYLETSLKSETLALVSRTVEDHRQVIEFFLEERKKDLQFIAESYPARDLADQANLSRIFRNLQFKSEAFTDLGVFNEAGVHLAYQGPFDLVGKVYSHTPWFQAVINREYYISDVFLGYRRVPHFIIAVVKQEEGRKWILRATIDSSYFGQLVEQVRIGRTGEAYLRNRAGEFQTERRSGGALMELDPDLGPFQPEHDGVRTFLAKDAKGVEYLYAAVWLNNIDWLLVARQEKDEAFRTLRRVTFLALLVTLAGGLIIVWMAFNTTRRIISRLELVDREKKELGRQLVVAGRLAELGEMSAGFAHEINNPLQIIKSEISLIGSIMAEMQAQGDLRGGEEADQVQDSLRQIKTEVDRCGGITKDLLKFARKKESQPDEVHLSSFMPEVLKLVTNKASVEGISLNLHVSEHTPPVWADPNHLEQVMI